MSEELVTREFFVFCEHKQVYLKRVCREGRWLVVACEDKAQQVELAWVDALEILGLIKWHERGDMMCPTRQMGISHRQIEGVENLVAAVPYAVHAISIEDFWRAYTNKDFTSRQDHQEREHQEYVSFFNEWGYISFPEYKHNLTWLDAPLAYIGPFHGDTEWWFGKGVK